MRQAVKQLTTDLVGRLQPLFGDRLVSVCVYGSALENDGHKDINTLVVLDSLQDADLEKATPVGTWWEKQAHALPVFLSRAEWCHSADIFALEYADIRDRHQVVYGQDLYSDITVHNEALRLVCELEIYRKLIFLRQRLLLHRDNPEVLLEMMRDSVKSLATLFRGVLRLSLPREAVPQSLEGVFDALPGILPGLDPAPFRLALGLRTDSKAIGKQKALSAFEAYIGQISLVNQYLNRGDLT